MSIITQEDINYLIHQPKDKINMIIAGMSALMKDTENKTAAMESQGWFQRMCKTITGKNKAELSDIRKNNDKIVLYLSEAIAELYNRQCISEKVVVSLKYQMNEIYAEYFQLENTLDAFVDKLNKKINSIDNFNMLVTEIDQGLYSIEEYPFISICKIISQLDERTLKNERKLSIIRRSLEKQQILNAESYPFESYLLALLNMSIEDAGQVYLELNTMRGDFIINLMLKTLDSYYFLQDMARKLKNTSKLVKSIMEEEGLDDSVLISMEDIYTVLLNSKKNMISVLDDVLEQEETTEEKSNKVYEENDEYDEYDEKLDRAFELKNEEKYEEAFYLFQELAENGSVFAMNELADFYYFGLGVQENEKMALKIYIDAYNMTNGKMAGLIAKDIGDVYYFGTELGENYIQAFKWYKIGAENENAQSYIDMAKCYREGLGVEKNIEKAIETFLEGYEQAKNDGDNELCGKILFMLGLTYLQEEQTENGIQCLYAAAEFENISAYIRLSNIHTYGMGVKKDDEKGLQLLKEAYKLGHEEYFGLIAHEIGNIYVNGSNLGENFEEAAKWYKIGVTYQHTPSYVTLAGLYYLGSGVNKNEKEALNLLLEGYQLAEEENEEEIAGKIAHQIGVIYNYGKDKDYSEAMEWYNKGVEKENLQCYIRMADLYFTKNDYEKALKIYKDILRTEDEKLKKCIMKRMNLIENGMKILIK